MTPLEHLNSSIARTALVISMKFSVFLLSFLATSRVTLAAPAASVDLADLPLDIGLEIRSSNPADEALAILEQRDYRVCEIINQTIRTIGTSKFT